MIVSAVVTPHPPIMVPGIGNDADLKRIGSTVRVMNELAQAMQRKNPDVIILISPHAPLRMDAFGINSEERLIGSLMQFGLPDVFAYENDPALVGEIIAMAEDEGVETYTHMSPLDHGALVPLWYLARDVKPKVVHLSFSCCELETHAHYGRILGDIAEADMRRIAIVASGDLSHRLTPKAPAGYSKMGKKFDETLLALIQKNDLQGICRLDAGIIEEAGECGLRSIVILLGALQKRACAPKVLSYEGPFGVGYAVVEVL